MGSAVLTATSTLVCAHGVPATIIPANARVTASGAPVLCIGDPVVVYRCHDQWPCLTLRLSGSARVRASGRPLAIATTALADGNGLPAVTVATQQRVLAG